jgi:4-hydroxybenzoate polyprenyltransferase
MFWVAGFDILYATQDADFDKKAGLHSIPARLGIRGALRMARACHCIMMAWLVPLYWLASDLLGLPYLAALAGVAVLLAVEHALVKENDLSRMNAAFFTVNAVVGIGLWLIILEEVLRNTGWLWT